MIPKRVMIVGGTHGNEWTGVYVVQKFSQMISREFSEFKIEWVHANPEAYKLNQRFKDEDLNRVFKKLPHPALSSSYEFQRARDLKELIQREEVLVIDLHTTTSNMGKTIIIPELNPLTLYLSSQVKEARILYSPDPDKKYLASQSPLGLMIEVGPVPQGVLLERALNQTLELIRDLLRALRFFPSQQEDLKLEIFEEVQDVFYPEVKGERAGLIHEEFQGKDFIPLLGEYTPFRLFSGEEIKLYAQEELYPIFINEAAYYKENIAFSLCRKRKVK